MVVFSLKWLNIRTPPEWLDLSQHMMLLPISMMLTFIYVLHVFSPVGRHETAMFLYRRQLNKLNAEENDIR